MKVHFDSISHSFSIMKKRAISIIAGDGSHFIVGRNLRVRGMGNSVLEHAGV
jgi:hypothetical protein